MTGRQRTAHTTRARKAAAKEKAVMIQILEYPSRRDQRDWAQREDGDIPPRVVAAYHSLAEAAGDITDRWQAARDVARRGGGELADHYRAEYSPNWAAVEHGRELVRCWGQCEQTGCDQDRDHEWTRILSKESAR